MLEECTSLEECKSLGSIQADSRTRQKLAEESVCFNIEKYPVSLQLFPGKSKTLSAVTGITPETAGEIKHFSGEIRHFSVESLNELR